MQMLVIVLNRLYSQDLHLALIFRPLLVKKVASVPQSYRVTFCRFGYSITRLNCPHLDTHLCCKYSDWN